MRNPLSQAIRSALQERRALLDRNEKMRNGTLGNPDAFGKRGSTQTWGRHFLSIPPEDLIVLETRNPALRSRDPKEFSAAWLEFERSDASLPYRVSEDYCGPSNPILFGAGGDRKAR